MACPDSEQVGETNTSYVYRTASSAALDILRRRRARQADRHDAIEDEGSHTTLEGSEIAERVIRAIDEIPASRRPPVRMDLAGYPREEIAKLMGWTEANLRERLTAEGIGWDTAGGTSW